MLPEWVSGRRMCLLLAVTGDCCVQDHRVRHTNQKSEEGRHTSANIAASAVWEYLFTDGAVELWTSFSRFHHQAVLEGQDRKQNVTVLVPRSDRLENEDELFSLKIKMGLLYYLCRKHPGTFCCWVWFPHRLTSPSLL